MAAPTPYNLNEPIFDKNVAINLNELNNKHEFSYTGYSVTIGLFNEYFILFSESEENGDSFQLKITYENLIENIPNFKMLSNISDILSLIKQLFEGKKVDLIKEGDSLKVNIKLKNMLGNDEEHELKLEKIELTEKQNMEIMNEKIKNLENKMSTIITENEELKNKIQILTEDNKMIKDQLNIIKKKLNLAQNKKNESLIDSQSSIINNINNKKNDSSNTNNTINIKTNMNIDNNTNINKNNNIIINFNSKIFNQISEITFILDEIKKKGNYIKGINLIFRASEDGDRMDKFNNKCDNRENALIIIKTTKGYIFGGFTKVGWNNKSKDVFDDNAFIFSYNLKKIYNIKNPKYALHRQSGDGRISFGSSSYVFLLGNNFLNRNSSTTDKMIDYIGENMDKEINGGEKNFKVLELEVFQISF